MNYRNKGKSPFLKIISIILVLAMTITVIGRPYYVHADDPENSGAYSMLGAYYDLTIEDYDDFYKSASSVILDIFHSYWDRAAAAGASAAAEYDGEYDEVSVDIISDNDLALSKELINSVVAKWYVANIFYSGLKPEDREINKEYFLDFLREQALNDAVFSISSPVYDISSYEKITDDDEDNEYEDEDSEVTEPETETSADVPVMPDAEELPETATEEEPALSEPELPEPEYTEPECTEPELPEPEYTEPEADTSDQELTEAYDDSSEDSSMDGAADAPDVLFKSAGAYSRIRPASAPLSDSSPETITAYTGTVTIKISADLEVIGNRMINDLIGLYASEDGVTEKQIRDRISELTYELNVKYATAETVQTLFKAEKIISDMIKSSEYTLEAVLSWYYIIGDNMTDTELSGLFIGSCGVESRLADRGLFPKGYNVKEPYHWVYFFEAEEGASIHYMKDNNGGYSTDSEYIPEKGDIVIYDNITDATGEFDGIGLVSGYDEASDTITAVQVMDKKLTETKGIMRIDAECKEEWNVLCYIHPAYRAEAGLNYTWPLPEGYSSVTSGFHADTAWRIKNDLIMHTGIDIECPAYTPVYAVSDGRVVLRDWDASCGNVLIIEHDGIYSEYHHLSSYAAGIEAGTLVEKGETVAFSGNTGSATTGPHLHYGLTTGYGYLWVNSGATKYQTANYIDPLDESAIECYFPPVQAYAQEEEQAPETMPQPSFENSAETETFVQ